jgi:alpha-N-arabinofuranosidase
MDAYNTFEKPDVVKEEEFKGYTVNENGISFEMPACSVVQFRVK